MKSSDTNSIQGSLSAFVDGELSSHELTEAEMIDLACRDEDIMSYWQSLHVVRDVIQGDHCSALPADFSARVSAQIALEETPFLSEAYEQAAEHTSEHSGAVVSMAQARERISNRRSSPEHTQAPTSRTPNRAATSSQQPFVMWKPVVGLGLAASLAGATFLFGQLWQSEQPNTSQLATAQQVSDDQTGATKQGIASVAQTTQQNTSNATLQTAAQIGSGGTRWRMDEEIKRNDEIEKRLNLLLTNHLEDASMGVVNGLMSHSKVVGYDSMPEEKSE